VPISQVEDFIPVKRFVHNLASLSNISIHGFGIAYANSHLSSGSFFYQLDTAPMFVWRRVKKTHSVLGCQSVPTVVLKRTSTLVVGKTGIDEDPIVHSVNVLGADSGATAGRTVAGRCYLVYPIHDFHGFMPPLVIEGIHAHSTIPNHWYSPLELPDRAWYIPGHIGPVQPTFAMEEQDMPKEYFADAARSERSYSPAIKVTGVTTVYLAGVGATTDETGKS
jgi:hypothetical protein